MMYGKRWREYAWLVPPCTWPNMRHIPICALPQHSLLSRGRAMNPATTMLILRMLEKTPLWIRHDLQSQDPMTRRRAEETLAAMIANALGSGDNQPDGIA